MSPVTVRFLGSGDAFGSGGRLQTCFFLEGAEEPVLIDCGATALIALKRADIDPSTVGWVVLSHLHGDHFGGLPWLILDGQFSDRTKPLVIAGPPGTAERLERAFEALYPGAAGRERPFEISVVELEERTPCQLGPAVVSAFEVCHSSGAPSNALRVQYGGRMIAYSGDTEWTDTLIDVADRADLFICECNFLDKRAPGHIDYRTFAGKRELLHSRRLILTHMSDEMLANLDEVGEETASDGATITL
jgi:ribonuclease BN (tRNA processing enzyme)